MSFLSLEVKYYGIYTKFITLIITIFLFGSKTFAQGDDCTNALPLTNLQNYCSANAEYTTVGSTASGYAAAGCWNQGNDNDVWFQFNAIATDITISVNGNYNGYGTLNRPEVALYSGTCGGTINELTCDASAAGEQFASAYRGTLVVGNTYFIRVNGNGEGTFQLCVNNFIQPPASGADCADGAILCSKDAFRRILYK
jgi:hypothetical protein